MNNWSCGANVLPHTPVCHGPTAEQKTNLTIVTGSGAANVLPHTAVRQGLVAEKMFLALVTGPGPANVLPHTPECHGLMADKLFLIAFFGSWWWVWQELLFARFVVRSCLASPNLLRLFVWPCVFPPGFVFARVFVRLGVCSPVCFRPLFCSPGSGSPHYLFCHGLETRRRTN